MSMGDVVRLQDQIALVARKIADCAQEVADLTVEMQRTTERLQALEDAATKPGKK